jgi:hypothetical protein
MPITVLLKIIAFIANGIGRHAYGIIICYKTKKQM